MIRSTEIQVVPIKEIKLNPKNRNKHPKEQIERLAKIMEYQGFRNPLIISSRTGLVVAGHGRYMAAKKLKLKEVPIMVQDFDSEEQEYAAQVSDNAIGSWAELDLSGINTDLSDLGPDFDIDLLGIKGFEIEVADRELGDEEAVPELKPDAVTKLGDVYRLGNHRLMCGDSTSVDAVDRLMSSEIADICFTSPPYNIGKAPDGNRKYLNDSDEKESEDYCDFLFQFTTNAIAVAKFVFVNIQSLSGNKMALIDYLHLMRDNYADTIIWDKSHAQPAMANNVLNSRFEYIHILSQKANRSIGTREFRGTLDNVFSLNSNKDKEFANIHKATFPVEFAQHFVENFSSTSVYEPFGGSGTTMIACEKTNRKCFMMELDPNYCDVIVTRWENYTGQKAELIGET